MNRDKKLKILLPILMLIAIFVWVRAFKTSASKIRAKDGGKSFRVSSEEAELVSLIPTGKRRRERAKTAYTAWGRNPFIIEPSAKGVISKLSLEGIVWDEKEPKALINNVVVGIGDEIGGNTVVDIKQDKVILSNKSTNFELRLGE